MKQNPTVSKAKTSRTKKQPNNKRSYVAGDIFQTKYTTRSKGAIISSTDDVLVPTYTHEATEKGNVTTNTIKGYSRKYFKKPSMEITPSENIFAITGHRKQTHPIGEITGYPRNTSTASKRAKGRARDFPYARVDWFHMTRHHIEQYSKEFLVERIQLLEEEANSHYRDQKFERVNAEQQLHDDDILRAIAAVTEAINRSCYSANCRPPFSLLSQEDFSISLCEPLTPTSHVVRPQRTLFLPRVDIAGYHHRLAVVQPDTDETARVTWFDSVKERASRMRKKAVQDNEREEILRVLKHLGWFGLSTNQSISRFEVPDCTEQIDGWSCGAMSVLFAWITALGMTPVQGPRLPKRFAKMFCKLINLALAGHLDRWSIYAVIYRHGLADQRQPLSENLTFDGTELSNRTFPIRTITELNQLTKDIRATENYFDDPFPTMNQAERPPHGHYIYHGDWIPLRTSTPGNEMREWLQMRGFTPEDNVLGRTEQYLREKVQASGIEPSSDDVTLRFQHAIIQRAEREGVSYMTYFTQL